MIKKSKYPIHRWESIPVNATDNEVKDDYGECPMRKDVFEELSGFYDKSSAKYSITRQSEIYNNYPEYDLYLRKVFKLPLPMSYGR